MRLILACLLALAAPVSTAPAPATLTVTAYADARGLSAYWAVPAGQVLVCAQRRGAWPPAPDAPLGCVETTAGVMHVSIRDINLRMDQGAETLIIATDTDGAVLAWGRSETRVRYQVWWPWWGG